MTQNNSTSKPGRIGELDALRGIACIAVSFAHFHVGSSLISTLGLYAQHGVELFFLISGFVIFMTVRRKQNAVDFVVARAARLYPAYMVSVGLVAFLVYFFSAYVESPPSGNTLLLNLMIWHRLFHIDSVTVVYWTLWVELRFYVLMFLLILLRKTDKIDLFMWLWLGAVVLYEIVSVLFWKDDKIPYLSYVQAMLVPNYAHYFISGIVFYKFAHREHLPSHWVLMLLCIFREFYLFSYHKTPVALFCYGIFTLLVLGKLGFLQKAPLLILGKISYSLYLVHQVLGDVIINFLEKNTAAGPFVQFLVAELTGIFVAFLVTYTVEYPSMRLIRGWYAKHRPKLFHEPNTA